MTTQTLFDIGDKLVVVGENPGVISNLTNEEIAHAGRVLKSLSGLIVESAHYDYGSYTWKIMVDGPDDVFANLLRLGAVIP